MRGDGTYLPRYFSPPLRSRLAQMWAAAVIVWAGTHPAELCISFQVRKCKLYVRSSSSTWETSLKEEWVWVGFGWWGNKSYAQLTPHPPPTTDIHFHPFGFVSSVLYWLNLGTTYFHNIHWRGSLSKMGGSWVFTQGGAVKRQILFSSHLLESLPIVSTVSSSLLIIVDAFNTQDSADTEQRCKRQFE